MKLHVLIKPVYAGQGNFFDEVVGVYSTDAKAEEASKNLKLQFSFQQASIVTFELDAPAR